jgi:hypothetical protein
MKTKQLPVLLLATVLLMGGGSGCATEALLRQAKPHYKLNPETKDYDEVPGEKGAYAGVPFAFVWDVATSPVLGLYILALWASGHRC